MLKQLVVCFAVTAALAQAEEPAKRAPEAAAKAAEKPLTPQEAAAKAKAEALAEAEEERYAGLPEGDREAIRSLDKSNRRLVEAWIAVRDSLQTQMDLNAVWGTRSRKDAVKRQAAIKRKLPRLEEKFDKLLEKEQDSVRKDLKALRKTLDRLTDQRPSPNAGIQARRDEKLERLRSEEEVLIGASSVLEEMDSSVTSYKRKVTYSDRLSQLGISRQNSEVRKHMEDFEDLLDALFEVRDHIADVQALEALKTSGEGWKRQHETALARATTSMDKAAAKLEAIAAKQQAEAEKDIAKMEPKIERADARIAKLPDDSSSQERYLEKKWDLEEELAVHERHIETLKELSDWKKFREAKDKKKRKKKAAGPAAEDAEEPPPAKAGGVNFFE